MSDTPEHVIRVHLMRGGFVQSKAAGGADADDLLAGATKDTLAEQMSGNAGYLSLDTDTGWAVFPLHAVSYVEACPAEDRF